MENVEEIIKKQAVAESTEASKETLQLIVFKAGKEEYAIHIDQIREVVPTPVISALPKSPSFVRGVTNIRGNIIAIIDLIKCLRLRVEGEESSDEYTLVLESKEYKMGVLVNEVPNTLNVTVDQIEDMNGLSMQDAKQSGYMKGLIKLRDRLVIYIDAIALITQQQWQEQGAESTHHDH